MKHFHYFSSLIAILAIIFLFPANAQARYGGIININVGESYEVDLGLSTYVTVSGSWSKTGTGFYISSSGPRSCSITGTKAGSGTLKYWGLVNADTYEVNYDVVVTDPNAGSVNTNTDDTDTSSTTSENDPTPTESWGDSGTFSISWYNKNDTEFTISSAKELAGLAYIVNTGSDNFYGKVVKLGADIDLSGKNWKPIGKRSAPFVGSFDGQNHAIEGIFIGRQSESLQDFGFFGYCKGTIYNLTIKGEVNIINPYRETNINSYYIGGLIGFASSSVENCRSEMNINYFSDIIPERSVYNIYMGGIVGYGRSIKYSSHKGDFVFTGDFRLSSFYVGGLAGTLYDKIECSENISSEITMKDYPYNSNAYSNNAGEKGNYFYKVLIGGIIGYSDDYPSVSHCNSIINLINVDERGINNGIVGGIVNGKERGASYPKVKGCYSCINKIDQIGGIDTKSEYASIGYCISDQSASNFSNSDVNIYHQLSAITNKSANTEFTSSQMKTSAFLDELNMYPIVDLGEPIWTQDEGTFPYIAALYPKEKEQLALAANPAGGEIAVGTKVTLVANVAEAQIYYTLDGSEPSASSTLYTAPIAINESCTLKAVAMLDGYENSNILTETYIVTGNNSGIRGDVNGDGTVDVADIATIISIMAENARQQRAVTEEE